MTKSERRYNTDELARIGKEAFEQQVRPTLKAEDDGKYVAIDVVTRTYEIDEDDWTAVSRVRSDHSAAEVWLMRAGFPTAYQIR